MEKKTQWKNKIHRETLLRTSRNTIAEQFLKRNDDRIPDVIPKLAECPKIDDFKIKSRYKRNLCDQSPYKPLDHIFQDFKKGHMSFFGVAGSGKTTLLKIIARNAMSKKYEGLKEVSLVVFLRCCDLNSVSKKLPMEHLLTNVPGITPEDAKTVSRYVENYPEQVLFVLDALDTFASNERSAKKRITKANKKASAVQTIFSLLQGQLFSGCRIITSTRDYTPENYQYLDPDRTVRLAGLTVNDITALVRCYFDEKEANNVIDELRKTPVLLTLCQTPVFLVFTLIGRKCNPKFTPTTMSQMVVFLLENFIRSFHSRETRIKDVLKKLQSLSFQLTRNGKVNFSGEDLKGIGLDLNMVKDVSIMMPGGTDQMNYFIHQSIQEMLATFHIAEMEFEEFRSFVSSSINQTKYQVLRQMLSGILCDQQLSEAAKHFFQGQDLEKKRNLLQKILRDEVQKIRPYDTAQNVLALLQTVYEANDGAKKIVSGFLKIIVLKICFLSPSDLHVIGTVVAQCTSLDSLEITNGNLSDDELGSLWKYISGSGVEISHINISGSPNGPQSFRSSGFKDLGEMVKCCKTKRLDAFGLYLTSNRLEDLKNGLSDFQLEHLNISHNPDTDSEEKMLPASRSSLTPVTFKPDVTGLADDVKEIVSRQEVTLKVYEHKSWADAPYDLVHSISCLFPNVRESILLYGWKIDKFQQRMLQEKLDEQRKRDESSKNLKVHITKDTVLSGKFSVSPKSYECKPDQKESHAGPLTSNSTDRVQALSETNGSLTSNSTDCLQVLSETNGMDSEEPQEKTSTYPREECGEEVWELLEKVEDIAHFGQLLSQRPQMIKKSIRKIQIAHRDLSEADIGILKGFSELDEFELRGSDVEEGLFSELQNVFQNGHCKVSTLSLTLVKSIDSLIPAACELMKLCQAEELNIEESSGSDELLKTLTENLESSEVTRFHKLNLSYNESVGDFETLGKMLVTMITDLKLVNCGLKNKNLRRMRDGVDRFDSKLKNLNISHNTDLTNEDVALLQQILNKEKVSLLAMEGCDLSEVELEGLDALSAEVESINLSYNTELSSDGAFIVGQTIKRLKTGQLALAGCSLDEDCLDSLLRSTVGHELPYLDIKGNVNISSHVDKLSQLIQNLSTKYLDISECKISGQQISEFVKSLGTYKLKWIDVSDSERKTDNKYITAVCELVSVVEKELVAIFPNCDKKGRSLLEDISKTKRTENGPGIIVQPRQRRKRIHGLTVFGSTV